MRRLLPLALLLALVGCVGLPTRGVVRRFEDNRFRACTIFTDWWTAELVDQCGEPTWLRPRVGIGVSDQVCVGYSSDAVAGSPQEVAAPQTVVCLVPSKRTRQTPAFNSTSPVWRDAPPDLDAYRVRAVFFVSRGPEVATSSAASGR